MFELICDGSLFCMWYQRATPHRLSVSPALHRKWMWYWSYCKRFFGATNYRVAGVVIEYYEKILISSVSIHLHGIW